MSPTDKRRSPAHRHRSFKGCWTCKKKRIQCDEVRPACGKCSSRGIICEGYEVRLRWGTGIASRGKYSGAEKPVEEYIPPPSKRKWNMRDKGKQSSHVTTEDRQKDAVLVSRDLAKGPVQVPPEQVAQRATVNILNSTWELNSPGGSKAISRHFEIPASLTDSPSMNAEMNVPWDLDTSGQYPGGSERRHILA
ncbi:hypothetical protein N7475_004269 [Penicillium sp. IBT 31633x]|nr:hypothetical protein N7475_004269 [Penicillium sp. IBT 31633x]